MTKRCPVCGHAPLGPLEEKLVNLLRSHRIPLYTSDIQDRVANGRGAVLRALASLEEKGLVAHEFTTATHSKHRAKKWRATPTGEAAA